MGLGITLLELSQAWGERATKTEVKADFNKVWEQMTPLAESRIKQEVNQEHILDFMRRFEQRMQRIEDKQDMTLKHILENRQKGE